MLLGKPEQKLRLKLKLLKEKLKLWNKEVFGCVEGRKKILIEELKWWDKKEEELVQPQRNSLRDLAKVLKKCWLWFLWKI